MSKKFYKISQDELEDFLESEWMLFRLVNAGVNNWEGYEKAGVLDTESRNAYLESCIEDFKEIGE